MFKKLFYTIVLSIFCAYILITRQYFYDLEFYLHNSIFKLMMLVMVPLLWVYMLIATILYNVFLVYMPSTIRKLSKALRVFWYYAFASITIFSLHMGQLEILFEMRGFTLMSSGYVTGGMFWFIVLLMVFLFTIQRRPQWNVLNIFVWQLFKGGLLVGQDNAQKNNSKQLKHEQLTEKDAVNRDVLSLSRSADQDVAEGDASANSTKVMTYHVLLFYFSRNEGSFFIDLEGKKWHSNISSKYLENLESRDWFVKINKNTYLNMWYFKRDMLNNYTLVMDKRISMDWSQAQIDEVQELLVVSERCRMYFRDHFMQRSQLPITGWGQYISYIS